MDNFFLRIPISYTNNRRNIIGESLKCLRAMVFTDRTLKWIGDPGGIIIQLVLGLWRRTWVLKSHK